MSDRKTVGPKSTWYFSKLRVAAPSTGVAAVSERRRRTRYKPGQLIIQSGIYKVYHNRHRLMHEVTLLQQTHFPRCKVCKDAVRFVLERPADGKHVLPFRSTALLVEWGPSGRAS